MKRTPAERAFRWLWNQKEVTCVLSGMNSLEMVEENVKTAASSEIGELTQKDEELLRQVVAAINEKIKVPCTGCRYCMPCPQNIEIRRELKKSKKELEGPVYNIAKKIVHKVLKH